MMRRTPVKSRRGQFLILSALGIVIMMITLSSLLAYTSLSRISLEKTDFRRVTAEVNLNFRRALATSLAEVSKKLDFKASVSRYSNYTTLNDYPDAKLGGYEFMTQWQKTILASYSGLGLNLSVSRPLFQCAWNSSSGYSKVSSNITLDILNYGFYGWRSQASIELNVTILDLDLNRTDGRTVAFYFYVGKENGVPVSGISENYAFILFKHVESDQLTLSKNFSLTYLGGGHYLANFTMYSTTILEGLDQIKDFIWENMTEEDFKPEYRENITETKSQLCGMVDEVIEKYNSSQLVQAYVNLTDDVRPKLNPEAPNSSRWVTEDANTTYVLALIDVVRSQLTPTVRIGLQDSRGIIVGAVRTLANYEEDTAGPRVKSIYASPSPTHGLSTVTLTATIDDLLTGFSNIEYVEYFVNETGPDGSGTPMSPSDGSFDSPSEEATAEIDVSSWAPGNYTIYVHGRDAAGFWGEARSITIEVTESQVMYVSNIEMYLYRWWFFYRAKAVVTILDGDGNPVENAMVYGHWSGSVSGDVNAQTNELGQVSFWSPWVWGRRRLTFTFTVDDVVLEGYVYDPDLNVETSDTIRT